MSGLPVRTALADRSVAEIVATFPGAAGRLRGLGIPIAGDPARPLARSVAEAGVDPAAVEAALAPLAPAADLVDPPADSRALIDHIFLEYHETHRHELPLLIELARKVEAVHAADPRAPHGLAHLLERLAAELDLHMHKEEMVLFPAMARGTEVDLAGPIGTMRLDHDDHGEALARLEELDGALTTPRDACRTWRALAAGTAKLADDLRRHIHLENEVLFPRFGA